MNKPSKCISPFSRWIFLLCAAAIVSPSQTFTTLVNFNGDDGAGPTESLVQGINGMLYGTTTDGGTGNVGTIFAMTPQGQLKSLLSFKGSDGFYPDCPLMIAPNGNTYGTTEGGTGDSRGGTVFRTTANGTLTTLFSFDYTDGAGPTAGLVQAFNGMLYGTTSAFGANHNGTVFEITPSGTLTTLHSFAGTDGATPASALIQARNGLLYGTTYAGGAYESGTVYTISQSGTFTTLYNFDFAVGGGSGPLGSLVEGADGNFYGTTKYGGANNYGTVFQITPAGTLTTLHNFDNTDGALPYAALVQGTDGNFYGTTSAGGTNDAGTIFQITSAGVLTTLYNFNTQDGYAPYGGLVQGTDGIFYGTASSGGILGNGTVYRLSMGLGPFVETLPGFGKVGARITILGTDLTGATSVTFNGTVATSFTVNAPSEITATVPAGAATGTVQVVTPRSTLLSNTTFLVLPTT